MGLFNKKEQTLPAYRPPIILDNVNSKVIDDLKETIRKGSKVSIAAASFSIYAFEALKKSLILSTNFVFFLLARLSQKKRRQKKRANSISLALAVNALFTALILKSDSATN